jgi:excinuclease ABC subunit B
MRKAIEETKRRRNMQIEYNKKHNIKPESIRKEIRDIAEAIAKGETELAVNEENKNTNKQVEVEVLIAQLEEEMYLAAKNLEFERAALIRDKIKMLRSGKGDKEVMTLSSPKNIQKERKNGLKIRQRYKVS